MPTAGFFFLFFSLIDQEVARVRSSLLGGNWVARADPLPLQRRRKRLADPIKVEEKQGRKKEEWGQKKKRKRDGGGEEWREGRKGGRQKKEREPKITGFERPLGHAACNSRRRRKVMTKK